MPGRYTSIQKKLMQVIVTTCGLMLVITFAALFVYEYVSYRAGARRELRQLAEVIAANSTSSLAFDTPEDATQLLTTLRSQRDVVAARLYRANGTVFAEYGRASELPRTDPSVSGYLFHGRYLDGIAVVQEGDRRLGTLYLREDLALMYDRLGLYAAFALLTIGIATLLSFLFSRSLQRSVSGPVLQLAAAASTVSEQKNYSVRVAYAGNDELGRLTAAFNAMLAQIEAQTAEISALNQGLERKVEERTRQLQDSNRSLQEQRDFTDKVIDASIDLIAVFDREGQYLAVNRTCEQRFNRSRQEMLGRHYTEVFPALKNARFDELFLQSLGGNTIVEEAYRSQVSDRWFQNYFVPLSGDSRVEQVLVIGHDITELMVTNERLKALNADLEQSNRDLEQFAYVASHDLQEPLRKIQTFADLSQRNLEHPQILERYMGKIASSAARMSNLIRDVLNYSRLSRTDTAEFMPVDLNAVLAGIKGDLELLLEEKGGIIESDPLPTVWGQPLQLGQLFQNLLGNALKFSERPPRIRIGTETVTGPAWPHGVELKAAVRYSLLRFEDNGIGFDPEYQDKVFAIFQRLHTGSEYAGTGIGLALCKKIAENHGGGIGVESTPGTGSTFFVYLPLDSRAAPSPTGAYDDSLDGTIV